MQKMFKKIPKNHQQKNLQITEYNNRNPPKTNKQIKQKTKQKTNKKEHYKIFREIQIKITTTYYCTHNRKANIN